jgi:outer membrane cobalamin receptor
MIIVPTEKGIRQALLEDNQTTTQQDTFQQDYTVTDMISMRFRFKNIQAGFHRWVKREGLGLWFSDYQHSRNERWSPKTTAAFVKYEQQLNEKFFISSFARYKLHSFDDENTYLSQLVGFRNGGLSLENLVNDAIPIYKSTYYASHSNQIRLENRLYYTPTIHQILMVGVENRLSSIQDNYYTSPTPNPELHPDNNVSHYFSNDVGLYTQYSQKMGQFSPKLKKLSFTTGIRWDFNRVHGEQRIAPLPTFRGVVIFHPRDYVFKLLYSSAFKTPTNQDFYSTVPGVRDITNPDLASEDVHSFELSARKFLDPFKTSSVQITAFHSRYINAIETVTLKDTIDGIPNPKRLESVGRRLIEGVEATIDYKYKLNNSCYAKAELSFKIASSLKAALRADKYNLDFMAK